MKIFKENKNDVAMVADVKRFLRGIVHFVIARSIATKRPFAEDSTLVVQSSSGDHSSGLPRFARNDGKILGVTKEVTRQIKSRRFWRLKWTQAKKLPAYISSFIKSEKVVILNLIQDPRLFLSGFRIQSGMTRQTRFTILGSTFLLLFVFALTIFLETNHRAEAAWFNSNWGYRQSFTITNSGSAQTGVQYLLTINTASLITNNKSQSNCADLRFTDATGNQLPYYVAAACNTYTTQVWVYLNNVPAGTSYIYMYYGNPSAGSNSSKGPFSTLSGLSAYYPLNEATGSAAYDASGNNFTGTINIGQGGTQTTTTQAWANGLAGKIQSSINLDGVDDFINLVSTPLVYVGGILNQGVNTEGAQVVNGVASDLTFPSGTQVSGNRYSTIDGNQGSLSFWYKPDYSATSSTLTHVIFESPNVIKLVYNGSTHTFQFGYWNGSNYTTLQVSSASQSYAANNWIYIAVTWNALNSPYLQLKINNQALAQYTTGTFTAQTPGTTNYIGSDKNQQNSAAGSIDDFVVTAYPLRQIETGTVTASGTTVTGSGTSFLNLSQSGYQDGFTIGGDPNFYTVNTISSNTSLALTSNATATTSGVFQAGQMTMLYNQGKGTSVATTIEPTQQLFYAAMDDNGNLVPSNPKGGISSSWTAYNSSTNPTGNLVPNGTLEAATTGLPTSWSKEGSLTTADAGTANIYADTRSQGFTVTAINQGITLTSNLTVTAGSRYKISAWMKSDGTNRAQLRIRNATGSTDLATLGTTSSTWQYVTTDILVPTGMTALNLFLESGTTASYTFYADDVGVWTMP